MRFTPSRAGRWLLLSDIHFRAHDLDRIQRTAHWIEKLPQLHKITRVVICGDLLSSRTNQPTHVLSACYRFLSNLIDTTPHVNILLGNHDLAHKREYTTTALDALSIRRFSPYVELHSGIGSHEWDGRRVLTLPFREDQTELTDAVARLDPRDAAETVGFAHLALHKAITQRHVIRPSTGKSVVRSITHRGLTGPGNFAALARTFTGHFHSHQTMIQPGERQDVDRLQGSVTYLGSPLQLTWADINDDKRGVVLLDPTTLQHELLVNPHAVDFITVDLEMTLRDGLAVDSVVGKHVMLIGELTQFKYVTARDKLLRLGARSVRNWSPMTPGMHTNEREGLHALGASIPASDHSLYGKPRGPQHPAGDEALDPAGAESQKEMSNTAQKAEDGSRQGPESAPQFHPLDLVQEAQEYVDALELDPSLARRTGELALVGIRLMQTAGTDTDDAAPSYQDILASAERPDHHPLSTVPSGPSHDAEAKHIFVAQPQTLTITNFLGVQETVTINFNDLPQGLAFIVGTNGSGKSTILEAMTWCQFGRCVRNGLAVNDVVNDVAGKNCSVSLDFENGYTISRYRKHKMYGNRVIVTYRGEVQTQLENDDMRSTQAAIDELLGIDYETYIRTVVLGHESAAGFLSSTAMQRRELIESLLGLSKLDDLFDFAKTMVKDIDEEEGNLRSLSEGMRQTITHIQGQITDLRKRRTKAETGAKSAATTLEATLEDRSALQDERNAFVEKMRQSQDSSNRVVSEVRDQVDQARRELENMGAQAHLADLRIAFDTEHSRTRNSLYEAQKRLQDFRMAAAGVKPPSRLRWRLLHGFNDLLVRLQQSLKDQDVGSSSGPKTFVGRMATSLWRALEYIGNTIQSIESDMEESKQRATLEQLHQNITTAVRELDALKVMSEQIPESVSKAHGVDQQEVVQSIKDMTVDEARAVAKQHAAAANRVSQLMADFNQALQKQMHQEQADRRQRDELEAELAKLEHSVLLLQNSVENGETQTKTYTQLLDKQKRSMETLRQKRAAQEVQIGQLASSRELFAFWETALSRRTSKGTSSSAATTFRGYVLSKSLSELNSVLSQILTILYDDTRHVRDMTSGMLRSLYHDSSSGGGDDDDDDTESQHILAASSPPSSGGAVLDKTLGISSSLSYAKRSGGERKRIDLALFFSLLHLGHSRSRHRARYLLVDEVFDGLDAAGQAVVVRWLVRWCRSSMATMDFVLVITHSEHMIRDSDGGEGCLRIEAKMGDSGTVFDFEG